jgi:hypothetical protein
MDTIYIDSPWALTSISQRQFWRPDQMEKYGDGRSATFFRWTFRTGIPGMLYGFCLPCNARGTDHEVWAQIKQHLNVAGAQQLEDANLLT